ncbi:pyridoxamine 5'-phosphate oxidase family protein [Allokutzneria sp. A3M-2-11 16]|uniref:pyridoxamine 5'-phosphate oxidase family protein n=1 Tax=Allokutzneria sp. A3M-2-11 16 TaxID=2962043 RepID=UPI0020B6C970|nr:pyridoxamine 5'-phosphate oxidase family protein [Allokutzneria sp. A3M-2-11 16]MCP3798402.1 pyridoxamine 5'-phosphate oxidase family protein [Allokutzneria sp. A3M-2-11 16]
MAVMTESKREEFLAGVHIGVISIARAEGPPLAVPVWYHYEPGGDVLVQTAPESLKYRLAEAAREFTLVVQDENPPYRYVSVSGPVVAIDHETPWAEVEALAYRYMEGDAAADFLKQMEGLTIATFRMRPRRWYSTDYSIGG